VGKGSFKALEEGVLAAEEEEEDSDNKERDCVALDLEVDDAGCFPFLVFLFFAYWGTWIFAESPAEDDLICFMVGALKALIGICCRARESVPEAATGLGSGKDLMSRLVTESATELRFREPNSVPTLQTEVGMCSGDLISPLAIEVVVILRFEPFVFASLGFFRNGMLLSCSCSTSEHQNRIKNKITFGTLN